MKKTLISTMSIMSIMSVTAAAFLAAAGITVSAAENVTYKFPVQDTAETHAALALFSNGSLTYCGLYNIEKDSDSAYITVGKDIAEKGSIAKIILFESGKILSNITVGQSPAVSPVPSATAVPSATPAAPTSAAPSVTPVTHTTATPENTLSPSAEPTLNPVYPKEIDAVSAFAVVRKVTKTILNDETVYNVNTLYQGGERSFYIKPDVTISSSPENGPSLTGEEAGALKEGDIISVKSSVAGSISDLVLVMRPPSKDILTSGKDYGSSFEFLYSKNFIPSAYKGDGIVLYNNIGNSRVQYAFGVITDKNSSSFILCGADGKSKHSLDVDFTKDTCVYGINADDANETSLESTAYIRKSAIPKAYFDDDDNIKEWNKECEYTYALVRIVENTATDIAVITY